MMITKINGKAVTANNAETITDSMKDFTVRSYYEHGIMEPLPMKKKSRYIMVFLPNSLYYQEFLIKTERR
jgi:hypothetical protein